MGNSQIFSVVAISCYAYNFVVTVVQVSLINVHIIATSKIVNESHLRLSLN